MKFVFLIGPSSAGKTSICKQVKQQAPHWKVTSLDNTLENLHKESLAELPKFVSKNTKLLTKYMTDEEIKAVCFTGVLNISKSTPPVTNLRFSSPKYEEAEEYVPKAGLKGQELKDFINELRSIGKFFDERSKINATERLLNEVFDPSLNDDDCIIIDIIPGNTIEQTTKILEEFQAHAEAFKNANSNRTVEVYTVLAYCPPADLSKRVLERNKTGIASEQRGYETPLVQLQGLVQAKPFPLKAGEVSLGHVSRSGMAEIAMTHEQHQDPKTKLENAIASGNRLASGFGMEEHQKIAHLVVPEEFKVDKVINTADGTPDQLAKKLLETTEEKPLSDKKGQSNQI